MSSEEYKDIYKYLTSASYTDGIIENRSDPSAKTLNVINSVLGSYFTIGIKLINHLL